MPKRRDSDQSKYIDRFDIMERTEPVNMYMLACKVPSIVSSFDKSFVKHAQEKPDWSLYTLKTYKGNPYILREMCDRCGKLWVPPSWRKIRLYYDDEIGGVYFETGLCKTCIDASIYVDKYLDGDPLTERDAKKLFYEYTEQYEKNWKYVLAAAPVQLLSEQDWRRACSFFNGCAFCGNTIETRAMFFTDKLHGKHTPWNVIPLCGACQRAHYAKLFHDKRPRVFCLLERFNKYKTIRMYLLQQMRRYGVYIEPILPYIERFYETKTLKGSE